MSQDDRSVFEKNERLGALVSALHEKVARLEAANQELTARYVEVEQLNSNLANLYVASYRIHGSLDREDVLATLREILINLIGTEEFAVYERDGSGALLQCATSFGLDPARVQAMRL